MIKKFMIEEIKKSNMIINFSQSYFEHLLKKDVERYYYMALRYAEKNK